MITQPTSLPEIVVVEPKVFADGRGFFMESYNRNRYAAAGIHEPFVQDNISFSQRGVLRGLHFQNPQQQGKLVSVLRGEVFDVAVDIRVGSRHFGRWVGEVLSEENKRQLYVPPGFAHGFLVTSNVALFAYKCTDYYNPQAEATIAWNDPDIGIAWPFDDPILSESDAAAPLLRDIKPERLPVRAD